MTNKKILIICKSVHHGNTTKIAKAMAEVLNAKIKEPSEVNISTINQYDLIGFGSGIYFQRHHKTILNLVDKLPKLQNKKVFIFSTKGTGPMWPYHKLLKNKLLSKNFKIIDEFSCKGFDTFGPLKIIGGINKNRPNKKDLKKAKNFAEKIVSL